jgi:hypothetical protein
MLALQKQNSAVAKRRSQTRYKIKQHEFFTAPHVLQYAAKEKQSVHIKENMPEAAMHEHVRN